MKVAKKLVSLFLALVMVLSLTTIAMADGNGKPIATKAPATAPTTISSVTIGGTNAEFQVDGYNNPNSPTYDESQIFIRATLPAATVEEDLKSLTVVINMNGRSTVSGGTLTNVSGWSDNEETPHVYTAPNVDLLNKSYTIIVDDTTYILAAGINDNDQAQMAIDSTDPLAISNVKFNGAETTANVYRVTVQNPCMGNPYFVGNPIAAENDWTFCNYYISAQYVPTADSTAAVPATFRR